jgi:hypothetical protein
MSYDPVRGLSVQSCYLNKNTGNTFGTKNNSTVHTTQKVDFTYLSPPPWIHGLHWGLLRPIYGAFNEWDMGWIDRPLGSPHKGDAKSSQVTPMWSRSQAKTCSASAPRESPWDSTGNFRPIHTVDGPAKSFTRWYIRWFIQLFKGVFNIQGGAGFFETIHSINI